MKNVITETVKKGLCSGCGICAGISENCLGMNFNKYGEYVPIAGSCNSCNSCISVCPSINECTSPNVYTNYNYIGYSNMPEEREKGSSGGLTTRLLRTLLINKIVDGVVVVGSSSKAGIFFEPTIVTSVEEVIKYAGSKYYPIHFADIIKQLKKREGRFAIVGLPCVIKGFRLLQQKQPAIGNKIKYLIGLTCGHNKGKDYTSMLIRLTGVVEECVSFVQYRSKENIKNSNNYGFKAYLNNGQETKQINFLDSIIKDVWCGLYFSLNACFHCKDLLAEYADISFMDAWLKPYFDNPLGTSIVVIRNPELENLFESEFSKGNISLERVNEEKVIESQKGALRFKKSSLTERNKKSLYSNKRISDKLCLTNPIFRTIGFDLLKYKIYLQQTLKKLC